MDPLKIDMNFLPPEILSIRQNRALSMCEVHIQRDLEQETVKPKSTLERFVATFRTFAQLTEKKFKLTSLAKT